MPKQKTDDSDESQDRDPAAEPADDGIDGVGPAPAPVRVDVATDSSAGQKSPYRSRDLGQGVTIALGKLEEVLRNRPSDIGDILKLALGVEMSLIPADAHHAMSPGGDLVTVEHEVIRKYCLASMQWTAKMDEEYKSGSQDVLTIVLAVFALIIAVWSAALTLPMAETAKRWISIAMIVSLAVDAAFILRYRVAKDVELARKRLEKVTARFSPQVEYKVVAGAVRPGKKA